MNITTMVLTCPKCQGSMRLLERNGVEIDECVECSGVYLDRGELERIIDAEASAAMRMTGGYPMSYTDDLDNDSQLLRPRDRRRHPNRRWGIFDNLSE